MNPIFAQKIMLLMGALAMCTSDYHQRRSALYDQTPDAGDLRSADILEEFFGMSILDIGGTEALSAAFGLSEKGTMLLAKALRQDERNILEDHNFRAHALEKRCEDDQYDAAKIANFLATLEEEVLKRRLARYQSIVDQLPAGDQIAIRDRNISLHGREHPAIPRDIRRIEVLLAAEFPEEFVVEYRKLCKSVLANKGRPFRKVVIYPNAQANSERTGPIASIDMSESVQVIYTQEPPSATERETVPDARD